MKINWETDRSKAIIGETYIVTYEDGNGNRKVFWADDFDGEYFEWEKDNDMRYPDDFYNVVAFATLDEVDVNQLITDKVPTKWNYYIVLIKDEYSEGYDEYSTEYSLNISDYDPRTNCWEFFDGCVIGWCEWPEPYKG